MAGTLTLRKIEQADNKAIAALIRSVLTEFKANKPGTVYYDPTTDDLFHLFETPGAFYWIAEMDGEIAGGGGVYPTPGLPEGCCELVKLYLHAGTRGKGWGKKLIEQCFETAAELGFKQVYLETMPELHNAIGLYEKCGFTYLDGPLGQSGHFGCDIWMLKELEA
ncbi:GNAT family N-acetyltransferase [Deminuibacter soli]|uniref:GNAT family N-acetyltransferase n=1 Tax=Deminuibacter soli TaxID=2291815 RepID=A0A3E1NM30_9BACT|nr:GNAT family N-acetyltransferase [Deminuibacter soli]RFM28868.1 GNAT family N-acetyltransferase [Deminuibacter soli]